jgi:hypothetical protein
MISIILYVEILDVLEKAEHGGILRQTVDANEASRNTAPAQKVVPFSETLLRQHHECSSFTRQTVRDSLRMASFHHSRRIQLETRQVGSVRMQLQQTGKKRIEQRPVILLRPQPARPKPQHGGSTGYGNPEVEMVARRCRPVPRTGRPLCC